MKDTGHEPGARVDQALDQLPRGIEPARDLWPAIEARLEPRGARRSLHWPGLAAAGLLLAVVMPPVRAGLWTTTSR